MRKNSVKGVLMLLLTALIWGCAFVAQSTAMDNIGPYTFTTARSILGGLALIPVIIVMDSIKKKKGTYHKPDRTEKKNLVIGGILCGLALGIASCIQQKGICYTTVGKAGFITAMYILLVPVFGIVIKKKVPVKIWLCILIAIGGLYLLCINEKFSVGPGELLMLGCAAVFAIQILFVDNYAKKADGVKLSCIQFFVAAIVAAILMIIFEKPDIHSIIKAWLPILYAGILSSGVAYTLQVIAQKFTEPTVASLLMSLESVFATLAGVVILHQIPTGKEWGGIALMFTAIIISQLPAFKNLRYFRKNK